MKKRSGDINYIESDPLSTDSLPQSLLGATVTQALIDKIQYFESYANRTQICQNVNGFAQATFTSNLRPLMTLVPIDNDKTVDKTGCYVPLTTPKPKPVPDFITNIYNLIRGILSIIFPNIDY
jgi:hypothetical protein